MAMLDNQRVYPLQSLRSIHYPISLPPRGWSPRMSTTHALQGPAPVLVALLGILIRFMRARYRVPKWAWGTRQYMVVSIVMGYPNSQ